MKRKEEDSLSQEEGGRGEGKKVGFDQMVAVESAFIAWRIKKRILVPRKRRNCNFGKFLKKMISNRDVINIAE